MVLDTQNSMGFQIKEEDWPKVRLYLGIIRQAMIDAEDGKAAAKAWLASPWTSPGSFLYYKELLRDLVFGDPSPTPLPTRASLAVVIDPMEELEPVDQATDGLEGILADEAHEAGVRQKMRARDRARTEMAQRYCLTVDEYVSLCRDQAYCCASCGFNVQTEVVRNPGSELAWLHFPGRDEGGYCADCL